MNFPDFESIRALGESVRGPVPDAALLPCEAQDVGSDRIDFFWTQNDVGHAGVRGAEKNLDGKFGRRRHPADVDETRCAGARTWIWRGGINLMAGAADCFGEMPANGGIGRLCACRGHEADQTKEGYYFHKVGHFAAPERYERASIGVRFP